jgi:type IV pilus assembly protein PilO
MALIPDDPKQRNALVLAILTVALFYVFWAYWYAPKTEEISEKTAQRGRLDDTYGQAQVLSLRREELRAQLDAYAADVERLERLIPQSEEVAGLLNQISAAARQTGVSDPAMRPEAQEVGAFYTKESYEIGVIGDYHDIGRFLTAIASLPRIVTPVDLELTIYQGVEALLDPDVEFPLLANLRIQTYILPDESQSPPPEGTGSGEGA